MREELTKMLTEGHAHRAFQLLDTSGLLQEVLPEIAAMKGVEQPPQYHPEGDVFVHTLLLLDKLPAGGSKTLAWGALLHDVGKPPTFRVAPDRIRFDGHVEVGVKMAAEICRRLRFSNDETDQILALVDNHMRFADVQRMKQSTLKKFLRLPAFDEHLELHRIDCLSSHGQLDSYEYSREQMRSLPPEAIRPEAAANRPRSDCSGIRAGATLQRNPDHDRRRSTGRETHVARGSDRICAPRISGVTLGVRWALGPKSVGEVPPELPENKFSRTLYLKGPLISKNFGIA